MHFLNPEVHFIWISNSKTVNESTARLYPNSYKGSVRLFVDVIFRKEIHQVLRNFPGSRWSYSLRQWHFNCTIEVAKALILQLREVCDTDSSGVLQYFEQAKKIKFKALTSGIPEKNARALKEFEEWMEQQRYSDATVYHYLSHLFQFFKYYACRDFDTLTEADVIKFNYEIIIKGNLSVSYQSGVTGAIKLFYSRQAGAMIQSENLQRPFKEARLPEILSKDDVQQILMNIKNIKHRAILSLIYACGLRRGEAIKLKLSDLDSQRKLIYIRQAKGKKDRCVPFGDKLREVLVEYYKLYKPKVFLFEGQYGSMYGARSMDAILQAAVKKCRLSQHISLHTLRHSFATHHLESGTDIRYIQEILGHNSPKTTMIYTHVSMKKISEFKSPFDDLDLKK